MLRRFKNQPLSIQIYWKLTIMYFCISYLKNYRTVSYCCYSVAVLITIKLGVVLCAFEEDVYKSVIFQRTQKKYWNIYCALKCVLWHHSENFCRDVSPFPYHTPRTLAFLFLSFVSLLGTDKDCFTLNSINANLLSRFTREKAPLKYFKIAQKDESIRSVLLVVFRIKTFLMYYIYIFTFVHLGNCKCKLVHCSKSF